MSEKTFHKIQIVQTAQETGDRLARKQDTAFHADSDGVENYLINIHPESCYQEIEGFGGAFTEAGASTLYKLSPMKRQEIMHAYFNPAYGLGYNLCRTHINSCDFALGNYAYVEKDGDVNLESFDIGRDRQALIPFIMEALSVAGNQIKIFASPWSPPAWMKTTGMMNKGGKLKPECREVWARYFVKFIQAYAAEGINIWGITVQNEPKATQTWDSCIYTAEEERDFVRDYLGPALKEAGLEKVKVMVWDHNRERVVERAQTILSDPEAAKYIWGVGFHWYSGEHFEALSVAHDLFPNHKLLFTEGCLEKGVKLGVWSSGERYAHHIIGDLNNWTVGWTDWNMVLDEQGGPNHVGNYCDAPIIADTKTDTVHYQSSYYYIGHFTKFIRPGARRIGFSRYTDKLDVTAFKNPDGKIVVVVLNRTEEKLPFTLRLGQEIKEMESLPHSIVTLVML